MFKIALDFLEEGSYTASIWKDAEDADIEPTHLEKVEMEVTSETVIEGSMALGGGQVIYLKKN